MHYFFHTTLTRSLKTSSSLFSKKTHLRINFEYFVQKTIFQRKQTCFQGKFAQKLKVLRIMSRFPSIFFKLITRQIIKNLFFFTKWRKNWKSLYLALIYALSATLIYPFSSILPSNKKAFTH